MDSARHEAAEAPGDRGGRGHEEPPAGAPADRDGQQTADERPDEIRHARARAPETERGASPLGRKSGDGSRK